MQALFPEKIETQPYALQRPLISNQNPKFAPIFGSPTRTTCLKKSLSIAMTLATSRGQKSLSSCLFEVRRRSRPPRKIGKAVSSDLDFRQNLRSSGMNDEQFFLRTKRSAEPETLPGYSAQPIANLLILQGSRAESSVCIQFFSTGLFPLAPQAQPRLWDLEKPVRIRPLVGFWARGPTGSGADPRSPTWKDEFVRT